VSSPAQILAAFAPVDRAFADLVQPTQAPRPKAEDLLSVAGDPLLRAQAYRRLMSEHRWTARQLAKHLDVTEATVSSVMRLLDAPPEVQRKLQAGEINQSEAIAAVRTQSPKTVTAGSVFGRKGQRGTRVSFMTSNGCRIVIQSRRKIDGNATRYALLEIAGMFPATGPGA
jgi:hypothetical protein